MKRLLCVLLCLCALVQPKSEPEKYAALTFDDGPSGRFTRRLLEGLAERDVQATFLLCGYRIKQYPELTRDILQGGHEIGLHGYSHKCMSCMDAAAIRREIADTRALLPEGCVPVFLRPPGGIVSEAVRAQCREQGLSILSWSVDPKDWATHDAGSVVRAVEARTGDGDIILLHDMSDSSVDAALQILDDLTAKGFRFVTVSELARLRGTSVLPGQSYSRFPPAQTTIPGDRKTALSPRRRKIPLRRLCAALRPG